MSNNNNYLEVNAALWNERVGHHVTSDFYDMKSFAKGKSSLNDIELDLLGDVTDKKVLHLQCHFGQDTLSLARAGAIVTGLDFSEKAIDAAKNIAAELDLAASFICSDVYLADQVIAEKADIVFTSYGVLGWLPDLQKWANVIANCLRSGGELVLAEFHPFIWMYDNALTTISYSYFNKEVIIETEEATYADKSAVVSKKSVNWNHPISDVLTSLWNAGFDILFFREYDYSPYPAFPKSIEIGNGKYNIEGLEGKLPMVYSLKAVKK